MNLASRAVLAALASLVAAGCALKPRTAITSRAPAIVRGAFVDDYGQLYTIDDSMWQQGQAARYHVVRWDATGKFAIAQNDPANPTDGNRWTRIDWIELPQQAPYTWGYCYTAYQAASAAAALAAPPVGRETPRTGCNGFPFTRMRAIP
ncbi:MAG: hypothetical protein H0W15_05340 [Gemmatimonadales bacterium]|nr:hypothetical protein [Gemmatimonadales bacterium]